MNDFKLSLRSFDSKVHFFNGMYKLPVAPYPQITAVVANEKAKNPELSAKQALEKRILDFRSTLEKEINEGYDIIGWLKAGVKKNKDTGELEPYTVPDFLTDIADWLVDIQVYCASEMVKYGLPAPESKDIIMGSNFSKLDSNGQPIINAEGKVEKGPGYWRPEPQLKALIVEKIEEFENPKPMSRTNIVWREE